MTLSADYSEARVRTRLAQVLLEQSDNSRINQRQFSQRDMADLGGVDWGVVHSALSSLQQLGAIRIERNRIIINKSVLAVSAGKLPD
jgi:DNA-binding GntR family transcriptional regulator